MLGTQLVHALSRERRSPREDLQQHCRPTRGQTRFRSWHLSSGRSETFRLDCERIMSELYQKPGDVLDKRGGPTDVNSRILPGREAVLSEQRSVDSPAMAHPPFRLLRVSVLTTRKSGSPRAIISSSSR